MNAGGGALDHSKTGTSRYVIGLNIDAHLHQARAVLLEAACGGHGIAPKVVVSVGCSIPSSIARSLGECRIDATTTPQRSLLSAQLTDLAVDLVNRVLAHGVADVLAAGVGGFGVWDEDETGVRAYHGLVLTSLLAEATGLNIVDDFPSRDIAQGGLGGPVEAHGSGWLLLGPETQKEQPGVALVDLSETLQLAIVRPPVSRPRDSSAVSQTLVAFDVGPGTQLLDELTARLTGGKQAHDMGGRLAVQGRKIPELLHLWLSSPVFASNTWRPFGVSATPFVYESLRDAVQNNWSLSDLLCTATHFLAESVARALQHRLPASDRVEKIVLTGAGCRNGMLLRELRRRLTEVQVCPIEDFGFDGCDLPAASIAGLTFLHIDQIPACPTTGANVARVLGRLTPGSPANWHRLLRK